MAPKTAARDSVKKAARVLIRSTDQANGHIEKYFSRKTLHSPPGLQKQEDFSYRRKPVNIRHGEVSLARLKFRDQGQHLRIGR